MNRKAVSKIRIHPAIGIARLGNSPDGYFIGPELPGTFPDVTEYRDSKQFLKRQAARFRLFAYDDQDELIGEITANDPKIRIEWTVHLRNAKAAGRFFDGILHQDSHKRNSRVTRRSSLILDGRPVPIAGINQELNIYCKKFIEREFSPHLKLGTLRTDDAGRLLVLGGHGFSGSLTGSPLFKKSEGDDFANNNAWYDDTSDGSVRATITWDGGTNHKVEAMPAWVIVAPPKFAPTLESIITLYDTLYQLALDKKLLKTARLMRILRPRSKPSFRKDIYPILRRAHEMSYVFARAGVGHENEINLIDLSQEQFELICERAHHIVRQFRVPSPDPKKPGKGLGKMPYIWSDLFLMDDNKDPANPVNATLTQHQYDVMEAWAAGRFARDWGNTTVAEKRITPEGLDRAALETCVGAAFYPGIEVSFHIRDKFEYIEPFRLDASKIKPGEVTQQMSLPWQTDFTYCSDGDLPFVWWPAQRPIDVRLEHAIAEPPVRWARGFQGGKADITPETMVRDWWRLGLIKSTGSCFVETKRVDHTTRAPHPPKARSKHSDATK